MSPLPTREYDGHVLDAAQSLHVVLSPWTEENLQKIAAMTVQQRLQETGGLFNWRSAS